MSIIPDSAQFLSDREAWSVQLDWLAAFARKPSGGQINAPKGFMWHLFSFGLRKHLRGANARHAFERQPVVPYYLFSEAMTDCVAVESGPYPSFAGDGDWYVIPQDFSWTYVSTHERTEYFAERGP